MKKTIIFCYSVHHGNTQKIADAVHDHCGIDLIMLPYKEQPDLQKYDLVGFASGIYMSNFGCPIVELIDSLEGLDKKDCFTIYTSGASSDKLDKEFVKKLKNRGANVAGRFSCRGFDTFGPFKLVGGIRKGHPNSQDIEEAISFCENLIAK